MCKKHNKHLEIGYSSGGEIKKERKIQPPVAAAIRIARGKTKNNKTYSKN